MPWNKVANLKGPSGLRYSGNVISAANTGAFSLTFPTPLALNTVFSLDVEAGADANFAYAVQWKRTYNTAKDKIVGVSGITTRSVMALLLLGTITGPFGPLLVSVLALDPKTD